MVKCPRCTTRKAKRNCPALGQSICQLCCGRLREKDISCPQDCSHLAAHRSYQEKRSASKKQSTLRRLRPEQDILRDERMAWLTLHIEAPLKLMAERDRAFTDRDCLGALRYALEKIKRESGRLILPQAELQPPHETGDAIFKSIEACRYEKKIILPDEVTAYTRDEKLKCLERVILSVETLSGEDLGGRAYIDRLMERFSKIKPALFL